MKTVHQLLASAIWVMTLSSCTKDIVIKPYAYLNVRFTENEEYDFMETINGSWDVLNGKADIDATGYSLQRFKLYLSDIRDTGIYANPTIQNISYSDGMDFRAIEVLHGFIHIGSIDSANIRGDFRIYFRSNFNGSTSRTVVGNFGILHQR